MVEAEVEVVVVVVVVAFFVVGAAVTSAVDKELPGDVVPAPRKISSGGCGAGDGGVNGEGERDASLRLTFFDQIE